MKSNSIFERVADMVTMRDVISQYVAPVNNESGRICCPLHNGQHKNLSYNEKVFNCFVCGEHGNAISFVAKLHNVSNFDALKMIDNDFKLGVLDAPQSILAKRKAAERKLEISQRHQDPDDLRRIRDNYAAIHRILFKWRVSQPADSDKYQIALSWLPMVENALDEIEGRM